MVNLHLDQCSLHWAQWKRQLALGDRNPYQYIQKCRTSILDDSVITSPVIRAHYSHSSLTVQALLRIVASSLPIPMAVDVWTSRIIAFFQWTRRQPDLILILTPSSSS